MALTLGEFMEEAGGETFSQHYDKREYTSKKDGRVVTVTLPEISFSNVAMHHMRALGSYDGDNGQTKLLTAALTLDPASSVSKELVKFTEIVHSDIGRQTGVFRGMPTVNGKTIRCTSKKGTEYDLPVVGRFIDHENEYGCEVQWNLKTSASAKTDAERSYDTVARLFIERKSAGGRSASDRKFLEPGDGRGDWAVVPAYKSVSKVKRLFNGAESLQARIIVVPTIVHRVKGTVRTNSTPHVELNLEVRTVLVSKQPESPEQVESYKQMYGSGGGGGGLYPSNEVFYNEVIKKGGPHITGDRAAELGCTILNVLQPDFAERAQKLVDENIKFNVFNGSKYKDSRCTVDIKDSNNLPVLLSFVKPGVDDGEAGGLLAMLDGTSYDERKAFKSDKEGLRALKAKFVDSPFDGVKELSMLYEDEQLDPEFNTVGARVPAGLNLLMGLICRKIGGSLADLVVPTSDAKADPTKQMGKLRRMLQALMKKPETFGFATPENAVGLAKPPVKLLSLQQQRDLETAQRALDADDEDIDADDDDEEGGGGASRTKQLLNLRMRGFSPSVDWLDTGGVLVPGGDCKLGSGYPEVCLLMAFHISILSDGGWRSAVESGKPCPIHEISMVSGVTNLVGINRGAEGVVRKDAVQVDKSTGEMTIDISGTGALVKCDYLDSDDDDEVGERDPKRARVAAGGAGSSSDED